MKNRQSTADIPSLKNPLLLGCRLAYGAAVMLCLGAGAARATPPPTVLVLSVAEEGRQQDLLRTQVGELVQRAGARIVETTALSAAARACQDPGCLTELADNHRAEFVLSAHIERRSRHDRLIDMWLYRAKTGTDQSARELCDVRDLKDCLSSLAGKLIGPQLNGGVELEPAPSSPDDRKASGRTSTGPKAGVAGPMRLPGWRLGLGISLSALAVGTLATAIGATAMQGHEGPSGNCIPMGTVSGCAYDLTPLFAPSYAAAGALAIGAVLSFSLPTPRGSRKENH